MSQSRTILIIDDDQHVREMLQDFLHTKGFSILSAEDGLKGMELIKNKEVDLVILDAKLPCVTGIGLIQIARKQKSDLPIICMTDSGFADKTIVEQEKGVQVLTKPFDLKKMLQSINKMLN
jgi:DNA-binding response OmpR family regulator